MSKGEGKAKVAVGFPSRSAFDAAVLSSSDGPVVNLDGETVKGGTVPALEFKTAADGRIVMAGAGVEDSA